MLRQYSIDGVIVASSTLPVSFAEAFQSAGVPVVHLFGRHSAQAKVHTVGIDNFVAGQMAAQTLIARGYDTIGFMGGPETATSTQDRYTGFLSALRAHPNITHSVTYAKAYSFAAGREKMMQLIAAGPAQAYFCGDDVLSIGALSAAETAGLLVPDQIGFLGLNDMEMAHWANINLTTIHNPIKQVVAGSVELVVAMLLDPTECPKAVIFPCRIVERGTLRPLHS
jgi:DNA-binding LacI/PurR family transcriptional regulator